MPIEVREVVIRATISQQGESAGAAQGGGDASANEGLVSECVNQVLEILNDKLER